VSFNATSGVLSGIPASGTTGAYPITFTAQNMGIAPNVLIQNKDAYFSNGSGAPSQSITLGSSVNSADLLFCMVGWETAGGSLISSVTDSLGNSYSALPLVVHSPHQMQGFYAFSAASGADTVQVNFNGTGGAYVGIACAEWSGPTHLDVHAEAIGTGTAPASTAVTPSAAGELLIGYADDSGNFWSANSPWTLLSSTGYVRYGLEDQLSSTTSPAASAFTIGSAPWAAGIVAFGGSGTISVTQNFTLTVNLPFVPPAITSASSTTFTVGATGSFTATAIGYPVPILFETGALPTGVSFNPTTGVLGGTPALGTAGIYPITITAQNGVGAVATQNFTLNVTTISLVSIAVTPSNPAIFIAGTQQFTAIGTYSDASTVNLTGTATWNSANPTVATITSAGLATGVSAGTSAITANSGNVTSNTSTLKVNPGVSVYTSKDKFDRTIPGGSERCAVYDFGRFPSGNGGQSFRGG
jgi:large repetitive protein